MNKKFLGLLLVFLLIGCTKENDNQIIIGNVEPVQESNVKEVELDGREVSEIVTSLNTNSKEVTSIEQFINVSIKSDSTMFLDRDFKRINYTVNSYKDELFLLNDIKTDYKEFTEFSSFREIDGNAAYFYMNGELDYIPSHKEELIIDTDISWLLANAQEVEKSEKLIVNGQQLNTIMYKMPFKSLAYFLKHKVNFEIMQNLPNNSPSVVLAYDEGNHIRYIKMDVAEALNATRDREHKKYTIEILYSNQNQVEVTEPDWLDAPFSKAGKLFYYANNNLNSKASVNRRYKFDTPNVHTEFFQIFDAKVYGEYFYAKGYSDFYSEDDNKEWFVKDGKYGVSKKTTLTGDWYQVENKFYNRFVPYYNRMLPDLLAKSMCLDYKKGYLGYHNSFVKFPSNYSSVTEDGVTTYSFTMSVYEMRDTMFHDIDDKTTLQSPSEPVHISFIVNEEIGYIEQISVNYQEVLSNMDFIAEYTIEFFDFGSVEPFDDPSL